MRQKPAIRSRQAAARPAAAVCWRARIWRYVTCRVRWACRACRANWRALQFRKIYARDRVGARNTQHSKRRAPLLRTRERVRCARCVMCGHRNVARARACVLQEHLRTRWKSSRCHASVRTQAAWRNGCRDRRIACERRGPWRAASRQSDGGPRRGVCRTRRARMFPVNRERRHMADETGRRARSRQVAPVARGRGPRTTQTAAGRA